MPLELAIFFMFNVMYFYKFSFSLKYAFNIQFRALFDFLYMDGKAIVLILVTAL